MSSMVRERWSYKAALVGLAISSGVATYFAIKKYADRAKSGVGGGRPAHGSASQQQLQPQQQVGVKTEEQGKDKHIQEDRKVSGEGPETESTPVRTAPLTESRGQDGREEEARLPSPLTLPTELTPGGGGDTPPTSQQDMSESHSSFVNLSMSQVEQPVSLESSGTYEKVSMSQVEAAPAEHRSPSPPPSMEESIEPISMSQVCEEPPPVSSETATEEDKEKETSREEEKEEEKSEEEGQEEEEEEEAEEEEEKKDEEKDEEKEEEDEEEEEEEDEIRIPDSSPVPDVIPSAQIPETPPAPVDFVSEQRVLKTKDENDIVVIEEKTKSDEKDSDSDADSDES